MIVYCIKAPSGELLPKSIELSFDRCIYLYEQHARCLWSGLEREGYKCVIVDITENNKQTP